MSRIRYPGSKHKIRNVIIQRFPDEYKYPLFTESRSVYVEPFFGSGAVGWEILCVLREGTHVVINDKDYWLMCLWSSVKQNPEELIAKIKSAQLSAALFEEYKALDGDRSIDPLEAGFRKLLLHQMSFSGLGAMAGGPIGGRDQKNQQYTIGARWNVCEQILNIQQRSTLLNRFDVEIRCTDFKKLIGDTDSPNTFFYFDPPYVEKGAVLYKHNFTPEDHAQLARLVSHLKGKCLISYDDCPMVRALYPASRFNVEKIAMTYTICTNRKNSEVVITNF